MEIAMLALMISIVAIVLGVGGGIVQSVLKSQERRLELRLQSQQGTNEEVTAQLRALRTEIAGLRDTSTQFDMSLEHSVQRLEERLGRIESKRPASFGATEEPEGTQRVSLR